MAAEADKPPLDLYVRTLPTRLRAFLASLDRQLSNGWSRATDLEKKPAAFYHGKLFCYRCDARSDRPAATLSLSNWTDSTLKSDRVVPDRRCASGEWDLPKLAGDERLSVLQSFVNDAVAPIAAEHCVATLIVAVEDYGQAMMMLENIAG